MATPAMVALMEKTAYMSVKAQLEQGQTTVGTMITIEHFVGNACRNGCVCESKLITLIGKRLTFEVKAFDKSGCIGEGTHERFIVNSERFQLKANEKLSQ